MTWEELQAEELKVYSTPTCPDCRRLKQILKSKGVGFTEVDIAADPAAADYLVEKAGHRAIPYVELAGEMIKGWHKDAPGRWDETQFLADCAAAKA